MSLDAEFETILRESFEDFRMSRSERDQLQRFLAAQSIDADDLDRLLAKAFAIYAESVDGEAKTGVEWLKSAVRSLISPTAKPGGAKSTEYLAESYFSDKQDCAKKIVNLIDRAAKKIDVCVFTITHDSIADALLRAHRRGVAIRIVADGDKSADLGSDVDRLRSAGIGVRVDGSPYHMHHKYAIFDGAILLTGSFNWTRGAAENNRENFVLLSDARLLADFQNEFELLWDQWK